jgi:hypothetical protein
MCMQATGTLKVQATEPPLISDDEYESDDDDDADNNDNDGNDKIDEKPRKKKKLRNRQTVLSFNLQDLTSTTCKSPLYLPGPIRSTMIR